jgi:LacI family transcriptional regulator
MTLKQVAALASVSIKTVSRAMTGDGYVAEETRAEILRAAQKVGYVPNRAARTMRTKETGIVGLLAHMVTTSPFTTDIMRAVETEIGHSGRALLIADSAVGGLDRNLRLFREFRTDAVILVAAYHQCADSFFDATADRAVLLNCFSERSPAPSFVPDDEAGGYAQARHLLHLGHRRIGCIDLHPEMIAGGLRQAGIRRAFAEAGVALDPDLTRCGQIGPAEARRTVAFEAALDLLDRAVRPTALICSKDEFALQVLNAAAHLGLRVPDDLSLVGYDDMRVLSTTMRPALTTVALPYFEMGRLAARVAIGVDPAPAGRVRVACPLVERQSCRPLS